MDALRTAPLTLALTLSLGLAGCSQPNKQPPRGPVEVGVVTLVAGDVPVSTELTGRTAATTASDVRPQVDGIIQARLFEEGAVVHAGQPLYQIDPRPFIAAQNQAASTLESARATYVAAQAQADRYKTLSDSQAVSRQQIDTTIATARSDLALVHQYEAALQTARINLRYTRVLAPISGRIGRSSVTAGALVTASQTTALASIQQLDPIYVDITQSSDDVIALRRSLAKGALTPSKATVRLKYRDGSDYAQSGTLEFSEVTVDQVSGSVTLRARFPNPDGLLMPGMFVRVEAAQGTVPNAILAPQQGVARDPKGDATALVVGADNKVAQRSIIVSQAIGSKWLVTSGLKAGDRLIVEGTDKVKPGDLVKPVAPSAVNAS